MSTSVLLEQGGNEKKRQTDGHRDRKLVVWAFRETPTPINTALNRGAGFRV